MQRIGRVDRLGMRRPHVDPPEDFEPGLVEQFEQDGTRSQAEVLGQVAPHLGSAADLARALGPWVAAALIVAVAAWFIHQRLRRAA